MAEDPFEEKNNMRLFVAITLSEEMKAAIISLMHEMKPHVKGKYTPVQNLHLTLAFIGEIKNVSEVRDALGKISVKPFKLSLTDIGNFGDLLWIGVKGNQGLSGAAKAVRDALDNAGVDYDRKGFTPHITIVRNASGRWQGIKAPKTEMMVKRVSLMKSEQRNGKTVYSEVKLAENH